MPEDALRDSSWRIIQTIDRQSQSGGTVHSVTRDASGRIIGAATRPNSGGSSQTTYRDASGRLTGSARPISPGSSRTTYRDASGRMAGSADTIKYAETGNRSQYRDASGRLTGNQTTNGPSGSFIGNQRDASGHMVSSSSGIGKCQGRRPVW